jgi:hypothetical protein
LGGEGDVSNVSFIVTTATIIVVVNFYIDVIKVFTVCILFANIPLLGVVEFWGGGGQGICWGYGV